MGAPGESLVCRALGTPQRGFLSTLREWLVSWREAQREAYILPASEVGKLKETRARKPLSGSDEGGMATQGWRDLLVFCHSHITTI